MCFILECIYNCSQIMYIIYYINIYILYINIYNLFHYIYNEYNISPASRIINIAAATSQGWRYKKIYYIHMYVYL